MINNLLFFVSLALSNSQNVSIGEFLRQALKFIRNLFLDFVDWLYDVFKNLFDFLFDLFKWLGELLERLFQSLIDVLVAFFSVIYDLIRGLLYLIYMIGVLAVKFFTLIFQIGKLAWSFIVGLGKTVASMFYIEREFSGHGYSQMMGQIVKSLDVLQLDVVAYILLFIIWIMTAFGVIKILSTLARY